MRRVLALALLLAVVPAAGAATARERQIAGPISSVAVAGTDVSYADEYKRGCHEVRLWNVATRGDRRLASHCFVSTSTGSGVAGVIATQGRALWLTYTGGNIRDWSLWTKGGQAKAKRLAFLLGGRGRTAAGHPRQRLGRVASLRDRADDRRPRPERVAPLLVHGGGPGRLPERALARLRRGARERQRADVLGCRPVDSGALVRTQGRPGRRARRPGPDRQDCCRAGDPRRRPDADDPAATERSLPWLLRGACRVRDRPRVAAAPARPTATTASSAGSSRGSTHSSAGAGSPTRPVGSSASASGRSSARRPLDGRDLDLEEVAVEAATDDELAVLDQLELVPLDARERAHLDPSGADGPDRVVATDAFGVVRRVDRRLDRLRERVERAVGNDPPRPGACRRGAR